MKLCDYAHQVGVTYKTAYRWYKAGRLQGYQVDSGTLIIEEEKALLEKVVVYARVAPNENRGNLVSPAERLSAYCMAKGYQVERWSRRWVGGERQSV